MKVAPIKDFNRTHKQLCLLFACRLSLALRVTEQSDVLLGMYTTFKAE